MKKSLLIISALFIVSCGDNSGGGTAAALTTPEAKGRAAFSECAVCHTARENEPPRVGPNLFGVYGRTAGTADGFAYSDAMRNSGIVWNDETLDAYLTNPQKVVRGNRMSFAGERDAEKRANIIAYLKTLQPD